MKKRTINLMLSTALAMTVSLSGFSAVPAGGAEVVTLQEQTGEDDLEESVSENDVEESLSANSVADLTQDTVAPTTITADQLVAVDCSTAGTTYYYRFTKTEEVKANGIMISSASGGNSSYPSIKIYEVVGDNGKTLKKTYSDSYSTGTYFEFEDGKTYELEAGMWSSTGYGTYTFKIINGAKATGLELSIPKTTVKMGEVLPVTSSITLDNEALQYKYNVVTTVSDKLGWFVSNLFGTGYRYLRPIEVGTYSITASLRDFPIKKTINLEVLPPTITGEMKSGETKRVQIDGKGFVVYSFVPEADDVYVFESSSADGKNHDTYGYIYDSNFKRIATNDDGGEGSNFSITKELKKGETYYLAAKLYSESTTSEVSFNINLRGTEVETVKEVPVVIPVKPADDSVYIDTMKMDYRKLTLAKGRSFKLTLLTSPVVFDSTITWESSRPKVATVNQNGVVRAKMPGKSAVITATTSEGLVASCVVKVPKVEVKSTGVTVKKNEVTLKVGKTSKIKAKMTPANTTDNVTYKSKNEKVATVSSKGTITAVKKGKTKITVKTTSGKKAVINVIVK